MGKMNIQTKKKLAVTQTRKGQHGRPATLTTDSSDELVRRATRLAIDIHRGALKELERH
jgi:hypothetical protein